MCNSVSGHHKKKTKQNNPNTNQNKLREENILVTSTTAARKWLIDQRKKMCHSVITELVGLKSRAVLQKSIPPTSSAGKELDQQAMRREWSNDMKARLEVGTELDLGLPQMQGRWVVIYLLA